MHPRGKSGNLRGVGGGITYVSLPTHFLNFCLNKRLKKMQEAINFSKELCLFLNEQSMLLNSRV